MGNRAVITTDASLKGTGIYLHWNGGRDSIEGFLAYCKLRGYRTPEYCPEYAMACLTGVIVNFFGDGLSCGIGIAERMDDSDNGTYIIGGDWKIVGRVNYDYEEQKSHDLIDMMVAIDKEQPKPLGEDYIRAEEVDPSELSVGDKIYFNDGRGNVEVMPIVGIIEDYVYCFVKGKRTRLCGVPYVDRYSKEYGGDPSENSNNYITEPVRRYVERSEEDDV